MTPPALGCRVAFLPDVVHRDLEGEAVLLNLKTGVYFGLNATGTRIWHLLRERERLAGVRDAIVDEYEVDVTTCTADLLRFVGGLAAQGLIRLTDA